MAGFSIQVRWAIGIVLSLMSAVLAFTQLGFMGIELPNGNMTYVVVLLSVVAVASLLLGTVAGAAIGITAGAVLYAHAQIMPLDHYELLYVTPFTSIVMLGFAGLVMGVLFAFTLRNDPSQVKRAIYIMVVVVLVAWAYSLGFGYSTENMLLGNVAQTLGEDATDAAIAELARTTVVRLGDIVAQAWITAALAAVVCIIADYLARMIRSHQGSYGLRTVFGAWLSVAVAVTFMAMAATSFVVATGDQVRDAEKNMNADMDYLCKQMEDANAKSRNLASFIENVGIKYEDLTLDDFELLLGATGSNNLLQNYDKNENGTAIAVSFGSISMSNDEQFSPPDSVGDVFSEDMMRAVETSMETGKMIRFVFDGTKQMINDEDYTGQPYIAYMLVRRVDLINPDGVNIPCVLILFQDSDLVFQSRGPIMEWLTASSLALMIIVSAIVFLLLNRLVARRIDEENSALESITAGDLDVRATASGTREIESLTGGINKTVDALKGWITEAETRIDAELATAKAIQESALPRNFPPFPDIRKFDIYASMQPAKQVGGDFYDFFLIGEESGTSSGKLGFVVADVSGKGVPAALFMMKAKALIRDYVGSGMELGEAISEANRQICDGNDAGMFVTAWVGVLDYATGHVDYVNAGHNPPLLWAFDADNEGRGARGGAWQWLTKKSGLPLGLFDGMPYNAYTLDCLPGDMFVLYSDGVTEAMDVNEALYVEDRLMALAEECYLQHPREFLDSVRRDVARFAEGAEQSDDITILTLEVGVPPEITATLEVPAETSKLDEVNDFLHAELDKRLCPKRVQNQLDLAVEELFVNVCRYAYPDATAEEPGTVRVQRTYNAEPPCVTVDLVDYGIAFNPLEKRDNDLPTSVDELTIGGLGIFMVKQLVNDISYERVGSSNVVTIVKKW